ncbi:MAG: hypothetical protein ACXW5U_29250 [Thermoanaerobaculia bacterium]
MAPPPDEMTEGVVLRFGIRSEDELFFAERRKPLVGDFDLGSDEEVEAAEKKYAALSVWDERRTTVEQARAFISPNRRLPIWLSVPQVRAMHSLRVVRRPHPKLLSGRDGHCDIENVWPSDKATFKKIRSDLREIATCNRDELN